MLKWILISLALVGCTQNAKPGDESTYLLPWPNAQGVYEPREITLSTLASPYEAKGAAAEVHFQGVLGDKGFTGAVARTHLTKAGHVYVPLDAESGLVLSVYAQFERLYQYELALGTANQLSWPRQVGVEFVLNVSEGDAHNNAHYFQNADAIGLLPYSLDRVPFALNHGIVAHEHFHAHFQHEVLNPLESFETKRTPDNLDPHSARQLNNIVLRAWNEGLADLFAAIYVGRADFFSNSVPQLARARSLSEDLIPFWTAEDLRQRSTAEVLSEDQLMGLAYSQGTALARLLFRRAIRDPESPQKFIARILQRLKNIPAQISMGLALEVMEFDVIVPILLDGLDPDREACADLRATISKTTLLRSFAKCSTR